MGLELSICDRFKGAENGKGSFCIANVRHLTAKRDQLLRHQNRRYLTSARPRVCVTIASKRRATDSRAALAHEGARALNSTIFLNLQIAARAAAAGPSARLEGAVLTPKTPEQRSRAV